MSPVMAEMKVTPYGFPSGRVASFNFKETTRNGNDLAHEIEQTIVAESIRNLADFLMAGGHSRLRTFAAFIERECRVRGEDAKESRHAG